MANNVLFVFCWDHECVSAYGMCPLVVVVVVGGGGRRERFESKSSAMSEVTSPMNKYLDCAEYILLIYCLICWFESLCLLAAFDTSDFFVVPVKWTRDKQTRSCHKSALLGMNKKKNNSNNNKTTKR